MPVWMPLTIQQIPSVMPALGSTTNSGGSLEYSSSEERDPKSIVTAHKYWSQPNLSQLYTQQNPSVDPYSSTIVQPQPKYPIPHPWPSFPLERSRKSSFGSSTPDMTLNDAENNTQKGTISVLHSDE